MKIIKLILPVIILLLLTVFSSLAENKMLRFESTGRVEFPDSESLDLNTTEFTVEAWVYIESYYNDLKCIIGKIGWTNTDWSYNFHLTENGRIHLNMRNTNGTSFPVYSTAVVPLNEWHHIAGVYDGYDMRVYLDGQLVCTPVAASGGIRQNNHPVRMGAWTSSDPNYFVGKMDEVRVWNYARTQSELQSYMYSILNPNETGLAAYWNFDIGESPNVLDITANSNNGTMSGPCYYENYSVPMIPPFAPVVSTGLPYTIVVQTAEINGASILNGSQIAVYDDTLCVGSAIFVNNNVVLTAWEKDTSLELPGFTAGNPMAFKLRTIWHSEVVEFDMNAEFIQGNGSFGSQPFTVVQLTQTTDLIPNIELEQQSVYCGNVPVGNNSLNYLRITNTGTTNLYLRNLLTNNNVFKLNKNNLLIPAGQTDSIGITFQPTQTGEQFANLTFSCDDPDIQNFVVPLTAFGTASLVALPKLSATNLNLGGTSVGVPVTASVDLTNLGLADLIVSSISTGSLNFSILSPQAFTLGYEESLEILIEFNPGIAGYFDAEISINSNVGNILFTAVGVASSGYFTSVAPTGLPYNILIDSAKIQNTNLSIGDEIAVFDDTLCVGVGTVFSNDLCLKTTGNGYIQIPSLTLPSSFTLEASAKFPLPSTSGGYRTLYQHAGNHHHILIHSNGLLGLYISSFYSSGFNVNTLTAGWHHIAVTSNGSRTKFYVDGDLVGTIPNVQGNPVNYIGNCPSCNQHTGLTDEYRIWNYERSSEQLKANMHRSLIGNETGLLAYWNFNNETAEDLSANSFNGTLFNTSKLMFGGPVCFENPLPVTVWEKDVENEYPGFTNGNPISYKFYANTYNTNLELTPVPTYSVGNGTFGNGLFSKLALNHDIVFAPKISTDTNSRFIGQAMLNSTLLDTIEVFNEGNAPLSLYIVSDNSEFSFLQNSYLIEGNSSVQIPIQFVPTNTAIRQTRITISSNSEENGTISYTLWGLGIPIYVPELAAYPNILNFAGVPVNSEKTETISLINQSSEILTISNISLDNEAFSLEVETPIVLAPSDMLELEISFAPLLKKGYSGVLSIVYNGYTNKIPVTGQGAAGHFNSVPETGLSYSIIVDSVSIQGFNLNLGDEIAAYDDTLCVGVARVTASGNSVYLDGNSSYIQSATDIPENGFTISFFFKTTNQNCGLFSAGTTLNSTRDRQVWLSNGMIYCRMASWENINSAGLNYADGAWHQVVYVAGGGEGSQKLYVDGVLKAVGVKAVSAFTEQNNFAIGYSNQATNPFFTGWVDEVRIKNYAMSATQIKNELNLNISPQSEGLISYFNFDDSEIIDITGNPSELTIFGNPILTNDGPIARNTILTTWQKDDDLLLPGFTPGHNITYKVWTKIYRTDVETFGNPVYKIGNGTFGNGTFSVVNLFANPNIEPPYNPNAINKWKYINVAASGLSRVLRIDTDNGQIVGVYQTNQASNGNPSRTTVDFDASVWVGNRAESSVCKIGLIIGGTRCNADSTPNPNGDYLLPPFDYPVDAIEKYDRNGDGLIKTSMGLKDGTFHVLPWTSGVPDDELITYYGGLNQYCSTMNYMRHISVDQDNNIWAGAHSSALGFVKLNGETGEVMEVNCNGCGGYGGLIDKNNVLWSSSRSPWGLLRRDLNTNTETCLSAYGSYGLTVDLTGNIWNANWEQGYVRKFADDGTLLENFNIGRAARGLAYNPSDKNVWVANTYQNTVCRMDTLGNVIKYVPVGAGPTGVAVDYNGKVWITNLDGDNVMRVDPNVDNGTVDLNVYLGAGAYPYNYSDMTGTTLRSILYPLPEVEVFGNVSVCENTAYQYRTTPQAGTINAWSAIGGTIIGSVVSDTINVLWGVSGEGEVKLVKELVATGGIDSTIVPIIINPIPNPIISGNQNVYTNSYEEYSVSTPENCFNSWTVEGGTIEGPVNENQAIVHWNGEVGVGIVRVVQTSDAGCQDTTEMEVTKQLNISSIDIDLATGWNLISSNVMPPDLSINSIFSYISTSVNIMKNLFGDMYVPAFGINSIVFWNMQQGYALNAMNNTILNIEGDIIIPQYYPIDMLYGWNLTAYLRDNPMSPTNALASLGTSLVLAKNNAGGLYVPSQGINTIGNMETGQGYYMYLNSASVLTYPSNSSRKLAVLSSLTPLPVNLIPRFKNTGNNATLLLDIEKNDGNEIGIFNLNGELIGAGAVHNGIAAVTVWGDDLLTSDIEGAEAGELLSVKLLNTKNNKLSELSMLNLRDLTLETDLNNMLYKENAIYSAKAIAQADEIADFKIECIPNPSSANTVFQFQITENNTLAEIEVYTIQGELVARMGNNIYTSGTHRVNYDVSNLANGVYNVVLRSGTERISTMMVIEK